MVVFFFHLKKITNYKERSTVSVYCLKTHRLQPIFLRKNGVSFGHDYDFNRSSRYTITLYCPTSHLKGFSRIHPSVLTRLLY